MRAAARAHPSTDRELSARHTLLRVAAAILATLALIFVWRPTVLHAQATQVDSAKAIAKPASKPASKPTSKEAPKAATKAPQDTSTTTHVVKGGETLWSIATRYYGDGHQWRALARRNGIPTNGETAIEVGMKLVVPARATVLASAAASKPLATNTTVPKAATAPAKEPAARPTPTPELVIPKKTGKLASQTADKSDAASKGGAKSVAKAPAVGGKDAKAEPKVVASTAPAATSAKADTIAAPGSKIWRTTVKAERIMSRGPAKIGLIDGADLRASRAKGEVATVFTHIVPDAAEAEEAVRAATRHAEPRPRRGEYLAAPFATSASRWTTAGRIVHRVDASSSSADERAQFGDEVIVAPAMGQRYSVGDELVAVRNGGALPNGATVAIPGGVLKVTRVDGSKVTARVQSLSGSIDLTHALLPIEGTPAPAAVRVEPVSGKDVEGMVQWLEEGSLLPSLQSYLVLSAGDAQGVRAGDQFVIVSTDPAGKDQRVATARVVRSSALGSTAILVRQSGSDIHVGSTARRVLRVP